TVQLVVLDSYNGMLVARKAYPKEGDAYPLNIALGDDDTLVWVTTSQLVTKDLFEPGLEPSHQSDPAKDEALLGTATAAAAAAPNADTNPRFAVCVRPDQLVIFDGQ